MSINLTDELLAKTKKGKIASAKQVFLDGDQENLQQIGEKTHQLEDAIKDISVSGGASTATAVSYNNETSGMTAVTAQGAIDELAAKNQEQDAAIGTKAEKSEVTDELDKKFNKENIAQEFGESKDKVVSQFALPFREIESPEFIKAIVDAEDHFLLGIQLDGSIEWGKGIPAPIRAKLQEIINQCQQDKTDLLKSINTLNEELTKKIELTNSDLSSVKENFELDLKGKSISILGDSLSTFQGYIPEGNAVYYPNTNNDVTAVEQTWWMQLINSSNAVLDTNNSWSGAKVSGNLNSAYTNRIGLVGNPDFLIIHGGTNDRSQNVPVGSLHFEAENSDLNIEEFADSYDLLVRKAITLYPNANIILIIPNISEEYASIINAIYKNYQLFACVDLRNYRFTWAAGHYQIEDMTTVKDAISKKIFVHKDVVYQQGMSLIDNEVASCFRVISNEEFLWAVVDSEDRVLFGFYRATGEPYYPLNEMYHVIQNDEYFAAWVTTDEKVVFGVRRDGEIIGEIHAVNALKQVISQLQSDLASLQEKVGTIDTNLKELLDVFSLQENPEYLAVEKDADGKVLAATNPDGSHYAYNLKSETIDAKVDKEEGKSLIDSNVADAHSTLEDPEKRMEIVTDADGKVISYRDADGKKHEHDMEVTNLEVSNLNLKGNSVNNIQDALKANGFSVKTPIDWSESSFIQIPEPRLAIINITNIDSMPTTKKDNKKAFLEFWDMHGNYFKKYAILNAQGNSSMAYVKKNVAIDLCDDEWIGDNTPKVRIGNWVPQDSFHMKAYYTDFFRGVGAVSYKLYDQIVRTRGNMYDRPWKKALLDMSKIGITTKSLGNPYVDDYSLLTDTGARCFPDGFPVAVYLNDKFYGIFSFQLKKHRDNYHMDKSTAQHVHLDGTINYNILWNGTIVWGTGDNGFEVRNPKNLYAIGGNKYDADIKQEEIAGEDEVNTWISAGQLPDGTIISSKIKKNLQMTAKVKKYIQNFANTINVIRAAESAYEASSKSDEDLKVFKQVFEKYYDVENLVDYVIFSDIVRNGDGFSKNWQWFTYDGVKWWVGLYDCDCTFGGFFTGDQIKNPITDHLNTSTNLPNGFITKYYAAELINRYKYLADKGIVSADNIYSLIQDWCMRIGTDFFKEEYKKWADSPCIADSVVRSEYWEVILDGNGNPQTDTSETFDATQAYNVDDEVSFGINNQMGFFKYKCIKSTAPLSTNTPHEISAYSPISSFKHCDNIYRVQKWIEQNTLNMDKVYNYIRNN